MEKEMKRQKLIAGRWTRAQHDKFMDALQKYGRDWVKVQKKIKTRTLLQIRSHAQKVFLNMTEEDIKAFIDNDQEDSSLQFHSNSHVKIKQKITNKTNFFKQIHNENTQKCSKKYEQSSFELDNTEITEKVGNEQLEQIFKNSVPQIIVSEVTNKQEFNNFINKQKNYQSLFLQMFKENKGYFLEGGDFFNLISNQQGNLQHLCFSTSQQHSLF